MVKAENSPQIPKKPEILQKNPYKTLKICRRASLGGWGVRLGRTGGVFPKIFSQGGILTLPPCTPLIKMDQI